MQLWVRGPHIRSHYTQHHRGRCTPRGTRRRWGLGRPGLFVAERGGVGVHRRPVEHQRPLLQLPWNLLAPQLGGES
uniref:Uncharacterized protein n=1 Tax=Anguilla anguilla TaxID=7936 RepID=A0A0E9USP4_ANGAN